MSAVGLILAGYIMARFTDRVVNDRGSWSNFVPVCSLVSFALFILGVAVSLGVLK